MANLSVIGFISNNLIIKMKFLKTFIIALILVVAIPKIASRPVVAQEASVLGASKIVFDNQLYIDGTQVLSPDKQISAKSNEPSFSGYTVPDVSIALTINSVTIDRKVTSDSKGFWLYKLDNKLETGKHTLKLNITDQSGKSSGEHLAATFMVPEVLGATALTDSTSVPTPNLNGFNYFTITASVFGLALILALLYLLLRRYRSRDN